MLKKCPRLHVRFQILKNKTIGHLFLAYSLPLRVYGKLYGGQEFSWIRLSVELK